MLILHDYIEHTDGGSRLCLDLGRKCKAPLLCGFTKAEHPFLQEGYAPGLATLMPPIAVPLLRQWLLALAFTHGTGRRSSAAWAKEAAHSCALYSGSYAPLAVQRLQSRHNVLYCHTPPRFLYDQHAAFAATVAAPLRPLFRAFCHWLRPRYEQALTHMQAIVANSATVQQRIQHYLGRESQIINPPCPVERYSWQPPEPYYLSMVRLDHLKRVHLLVEAFASLPSTVRLLIASDGPEGPALRRLAEKMQKNAQIRFTGTLNEAQRLDILSRCTATLCVAKDEDFGMCAVESLAAGKPVIVAGSGGLREIIAPHETGIVLAADPHPQEIAQAVSSLTPALALRMRTDCQQQAQKYSLQHFADAMRLVCKID